MTFHHTFFPLVVYSSLNKHLVKIDTRSMWVREPYLRESRKA